MSTKKKQKRRKRIFIHLKNDNINDFDYVIKCLMTICAHNYYQAHQCALIVHNKGNCVVASGFVPKLLLTFDEFIKCGLSAEIKTN